MIAQKNEIGRLRRLTVLTIAAIAAVIVSACAAPAAAPAAPTQAPAPTEAPVATQVPTDVPTALPATEAPAAAPESTEAPTAPPAPTDAPTAAPTEAQAPAPAASTVSFASDVQPIFEKSCAKCHGGSDGEKGDLNLRTYENLIKGGESGAVVVAGDPDNSLLVELIRDGEMPKRAANLPQEQIDLIAQWVAEGALNN